MQEEVEGKYEKKTHDSGDGGYAGFGKQDPAKYGPYDETPKMSGPQAGQS